MFNVIGRLHIGGRNTKNSWSHLQKSLNRKLMPMEKTKAVIEVKGKDDVRLIKERLKKYNNKYDTDFFMD